MGKATEAYEKVKFMEEFKAGDNVKFADSHPLAGQLGVVHAINQDGTFTVKVGHATQPPCTQAEIIKVDYEGNINVAAPATPAPADIPATQA